MQTLLNLPIVKPLIDLLNSRTFLLAVATSIVSTVITQIPALAPFANVLILVVVVLFTVLAAKLHAEKPKPIDLGDLAFLVSNAPTAESANSIISEGMKAAIREAIKAELDSLLPTTKSVQ